MCLFLGISIWGGEDVYPHDTLDTLYIRPQYRRQGHTLSLLYMLTSKLSPNEYLALSHPISMNMYQGMCLHIQEFQKGNVE